MRFGFVGRLGTVVFLLLLVSAGWSQNGSAGSPSASFSSSVPIAFEANRGQAAPQYRFISRHLGGDVRFTAAGPDLVLAGRGAAANIQLRVLGQGGNRVLEAQEPLPGRVNYLHGADPAHWITGTPIYNRIAYKDLLPGVDLLFYGDNGHLEHDFVVAPGADPASVRFTLNGADALHLSPHGDLAVSAAGKQLVLRRPEAYQGSGLQRTPVKASFRVRGKVVSFDLGAYDKSRALVIDPVLVFSTYLDGSSGDTSSAIATDTAGNIYVGGRTTSPDFPTAGAYKSTCTNCNDSQGDAYIAKLDPTGKTLLFSTYIGGSNDESIDDLKVDGNGNIVAVGATGSADFPKAGSYASASSGMFVLSLSASGTTLNHTEVLPGTETSYGDYGLNRYAIALDTANNIYVGGVTDVYQFISPYPTTAGTYGQGKYTSGEAPFATKFSPSGTLLYSTLIPPQSNNVSFFPHVGKIVADPQGNLYMAGLAQVGLPVTDTSSQPSNGGSGGYLLELSADATALSFSRFLPGVDTALALARAPDGTLYVTGNTSEANLPVSSIAFQKTPSCGQNGSCSGAYLMHVSADGTQILGATYLAGVPTDGGISFDSLALDASGNVFLAGNTGSSLFPMVGPVASYLDQTGNFFSVGSLLAEVSGDLSQLLFSSFFNGDGAGSIMSSMALSPSGRVVFTGGTYADTGFITTPGSFQPSAPPRLQPLIGYDHQFVASIDTSIPAPSACFDNRSPAFGNVPAGQISHVVVNLTNCGNAPLSIGSAVSGSSLVSVSQTCGTIAPGGVCGLQLNYAPIDSSGLSTTVTLTLNTQIPTQLLHVSGSGVAPKLSAPVSLGLGELVVGTTQPILLSASLSNVGTAPLTIIGLTASGDFAVTNHCPATLPVAYGFCSFEISFLPSATGVRTGTVTVLSNDPLYPQTVIPLSGTGLAQQPLPTLVSLSHQTQIVSSAGASIGVTGADFTPQSVVRVNGVPEPTTFQTNTALQVSIPPSLLSSLGELSLTVFNPGPGGGESQPQLLSVYKTLLINPAAVVSVPSRNMLYAAIPGSSTTNQNTVLPIDPTTGTPGTPIPVGHDPRLITASSDGAFLYVALNQDNAVQRINLQTQAVDRTFPFAVDQFCHCNNVSASDLEAVPGSPQEVLLAQTSLLSLYNDAGLVNTVPITHYPSATSFTSLALAGTPQAIYALPFTLDQQSFFSVIGLGPGGLVYALPTGGNYGGNNTTGNQVISDGNLLYTSSGEVWDPVAKTQTGSFLTTNTSAVLSYSGDPAITLDPDGKALFAFGQQNDSQNTSGLVLSGYNLQTLSLTGSLDFAPLYWPALSNLVRWGTNGYAFLASGAGLTDTELYIGVSSVISGATAGNNPTPVLTALSPTSASAGSPALTLTVTGAAFVPGSTVFFNGTGLVTTFVNSAQLQAAVPAALLGAPGTSQVSVTNPAPGGGTSVSVGFTITASTVAPQITFNLPNQVFGNAPFQVSATSNSPAPLTYSVVSGPATIAGTTVTLTGAGSVALQASQASTQGYQAGSQTATFLVAKATPQVAWATPASIPYGTALGSAQLNATSTTPGTFTYTPAAGTVPSAGTQMLSAVFTPADFANYTTATATTTLTVNKATPQITWPTPAGITYGTALGAAQLNATSNTPGAFTYTPAAGAALAAGTQTLSVSFIPTDTANNATANATSTLTVAQAPLTVTAADATRVFGAANPTFAATLNGVVHQDVLSASASSAALTTSPVGTYPILPAAAGDALPNYKVMTVNGTLTVTQAASSVTLATSAASTNTAVPVTFTATVASATSGTPTGTVQFLLNGTSPLGTASLANGTATLSSALPAGNQSITALYSGDPDFKGSASSAVAETVLVPDFAVTATPASLSIKQGQTGTATFTVTPLNGFNQAVSFSCGQLPSSVSCSFSPATITPSGGPVTSTLTVTTTAPTTAQSRDARPFRRSPRPLEVATALCLLPFVLRRRRAALSRLLALLLILAMPLLGGCGGGTNPPQLVGGTPVGTNQVSVTVSSGAGSTGSQHMANLTITITN